MCNKTVSIVMSIYKEPINWLSDSIFSILNQTYREIEFLIILDEPNRVDVIDFINKIDDSRINFIVNEKNKGLIYCLNLGIKLSSGYYIARMDADDVSSAFRIEKQLNYLNDNDLDLIGCKINIVDVDRKLLSKPKKLSNPKYITTLLKHGVTPLVHPTFFGKSEVFKVCGYNSLAVYAEDLEFICHAVVKGFKIGNSNETLLDCRYNFESITKKNTAQMELTVKNIQKSYNKFLNNKIYKFSYNNEDIRQNNTKKNLMFFRINVEKRKYLFAILFLFKAFLENPVHFLDILKRFFLINYFYFFDDKG